MVSSDQATSKAIKTKKLDIAIAPCKNFLKNLKNIIKR